MYKCPLISSNTARLQELLLQKLLGTIVPCTQFLLLHAKFSKERFFMCKLLKPPLAAQEVRRVLTVYMQSVVKALKALHGHNIAYLDVRLENICFDEGNRAVFIVLDRSKHCHALFNVGAFSDILLVIKECLSSQEEPILQLLFCKNGLFHENKIKMQTIVATIKQLEMYKWVIILNTLAKKHFGD